MTLDRMLTPRREPGRSVRPGVEDLFSAAVAGLGVGAVQASLWVGCVHAMEPNRAIRDDGFGQNINIPGALGFLIGLLIASVVLVTVSLARLRIRYYAVVASAVLVVEVVLAPRIALALPGNGLWRSLSACGVLAVELLSCRWFLSRPGDPLPDTTWWLSGK